jgi:hypothetical protein
VQSAATHVKEMQIISFYSVAAGALYPSFGSAPAAARARGPQSARTTRSVARRPVAMAVCAAGADYYLAHHSSRRRAA